MKELKIEIPEGYKIDEKNSTFEHIKFIKKEEFRPTYIDLGLPSKTMWADCNVGAENPWEYGEYFTFEEACKLHCPTKEQFDELREECTWEWRSFGYRVIGKNNQSIFLPAVGYWSRSHLTHYSDGAYYLYFLSSGICWGNGYRYCGQSVRPVTKLQFLK